MRVLVAYQSSTGRTKKVAEAIHGEIKAEKTMKRISEVEDMKQYDLAFLGFPVHVYGPDKKAKTFLEKQCLPGSNVVLFVTHGSPETNPDVAQWLDKYRQAACRANIVGVFDCQGQLAGSAKFFMRLSRDRKLREAAKRDNSKGQPDDSRIERAREFARETMAKFESGKQ
jgi:flavodoxin